jgi:hypothetical protein
VTWRFTGSGDSSVFVDDAAENSVPADRSVGRDDGRRVVVGWAVAAALVRSVIVEVLGVLVEDGRGVAFVEMRILSAHSDRTLRMNRSA